MLKKTAVFLSVFSVLLSAWGLAFSASANISGAIYTSIGDGTTVNNNTYASKEDVYLNGGPQNENAQGLPDGTYYFQVTNPSGSVLLSSDDIHCRKVTVSGGVIAGNSPSITPADCEHLNGSLNPNNSSIPVQLIPYDDTPNNGGVYKVWLTGVADYSPDSGVWGFIHSKSKTDNFRVLGQNPPPLPQTGMLIVNKITDPAEDPTVFSVTANGTGAITGDPTQDLSTSVAAVYEMDAGTYSVAESPLSGWDETGNTCVDVVVPAAGIAECDITNTKEATIIVQKHMIGGTDTFTFTGDPSGSISADNGTISESVIPGTYTSTEGAVSGWDLNSISCDNNNSTGDFDTATATFNVTAGQTATCTFTNTKRATIIVQKHMIGGTDTFTFTGDPSGSISADNGTISESVVPETYTSTETAVAGWDLNTIICDNENSTGNVGIMTATFNVTAGQTATCTFTNTKRGSISGNKWKDVDGNGTFNGADVKLANWTVFLDANGNSLLDTGETSMVTDTNGNYTFPNLVPGPYTVCEVMQSGWLQTSPGSTGCYSVTVGAGQDVTNKNFGNFYLVTRTLGFWQTHTGFTSGIFAANFSGGMLIGSGPHKGLITNTTSPSSSQLFGAYYSSIPYKSNGTTKRSAIDKARMQLLQQLVTAKLNCAAFGCMPATLTLIISADAAYASGPAGAILSYVSLLDAYNNSGDATPIVSGSPGSATPAASQASANKTFWDLP